MRILTISTLCAGLALPTPADAAGSISGHWFTVEKDSVVEIGPCGGGLCGRIARILAPQPKGPARDENNPNPALRTRPILGLTILSGFKDIGSQWQGSIYDPRAGKTYKSFLTLKPDGTLQVKGCVGFFCRSQTWTRAR